MIKSRRKMEHTRKDMELTSSAYLSLQPFSWTKKGRVFSFISLKAEVQTGCWTDSNNQDARSCQCMEVKEDILALANHLSKLLSPFELLISLASPKLQFLSKERDSPCTARHYVKSLHYRTRFHLQSPSSSWTGWEHRQQLENTVSVIQNATCTSSRWRLPTTY